MVIHFGWVYDALRAQQGRWVELGFDGAQSVVNLGPKLPLNPLASAQTIAVLAAVSTFIFTNQGAGFLGNRSHLGCTITAHIQNGAYMQGAYGGVRVPSAAASVPFKDFCECGGVVGQVFERNGAVLNEAHRFSIATKTHHDVETRFTHLPQVALWRGVSHAHHASG